MKQDETKLITITLKEYLELKEDAYFLWCLQDAGVDNWPGISYAYELRDSKEKDEDGDYPVAVG